MAAHSLIARVNTALDGAVEQVAGLSAVDRVAKPVAGWVSSTLGALGAKDLLSGAWLSHPLHPLLTDLPIGAWTSAMVLDCVPGAERAADVLVGTGIAAAVPAAVTGLSDWSDTIGEERRIGAVHAAANIVGLGLYAWSLRDRLNGRRGRGVLISVLGAGALAVGGFLGGHLITRLGVGVDHNVFAGGPDDWAHVDGPPVVSEGRLSSGPADGTNLVFTRSNGRVCALANRCSHAGGPLNEGELVDGAVRCPWHGSEFRFDDGAVTHGPATAPQPAYDTREDGDDLLVRRRT